MGVSFLDDVHLFHVGSKECKYHEKLFQACAPGKV